MQLTAEAASKLGGLEIFLDHAIFYRLTRIMQGNALQILEFYSDRQIGSKS